MRPGCALLVGHTRYYLRTIMDGAQIKLSPDDPRLLWNALDSAVKLRNFAEKRDAVHRALIVANMALAHHLGFQGPDPAFILYRLRAIAEREAASPGSCGAIRKLVEVEQELKGFYEMARPNPTPLLSELDRLLADLETAGWVPQERNPVQITEQRYRTLLQE